MGLQFYKPTKKVTGAACSLSFNSKEGCAFIELIKQVGWDEKARGGQGNGIFKGGEKTNLKLSQIECGAIIRAIETNSPGISPLVHVSEKGTKTVRFSQWGKDAQGNGEFKGWSLSVSSKEKDSEKETRVSCSLSFDEVIVVREYLKFALVHIFSAIYSADKKRGEERKAQGPAETPKQSPPKSIEKFVPKDEPVAAQEPSSEEDQW